MNFAVIGATGKSGLEVIRQGLERGHTIKALVRSPNKITTQHERLEVVKCNVWDADELARNIAGSDVLVSCIGGDGSWFNRRPITMYTDLAKVAVSAMKQTDVKLFMFMSSWYNTDAPGEPRGPIKYRFAKFLIVGNILKNMGEAEEYLDKEKDAITYTAVRAPILTDGRITSKEIKFASEKQYVKKAKTEMSRADVVRGMIQIAEEQSYQNQSVAIGVE